MSAARPCMCVMQAQAILLPPTLPCMNSSDVTLMACPECSGLLPDIARMSASKICKCGLSAERPHVTMCDHRLYLEQPSCLSDRE